MRKGKRKRIKRGALAAIVVLTVILCFVAALLITNVFIPIKYFSAFVAKREDYSHDGVEITFIDVGFGDCTFISLPDGKNILIDGGNGDYANNEKILKFLNVRGVDRINYLICTSVKDEHCGGLTELIKYKEVETAYIPYCTNTRVTSSYNSFVNQLKKRKISYSYAETGVSVIDGEQGYYMTFLSPISHMSANSEYSGLNEKANSENIETASAVIWFEYLGDAAIFTSDVRPAALKRIIDDYEQCVSVGEPYLPCDGMDVRFDKCRVMTAPAHAGKRNTCAEWCDCVQPDYTVISVGRNYADYPSKEAISDVLTYSKALYTFYSGNVTLTLCGGSYTVSEQNQSGDLELG